MTFLLGDVPVDIRERILKEFSELTAESERILQSCGWDGRKFHHFPNVSDYIRIRTRSLNLIGKACGQNSDHRKSLERIAITQNADHSPSMLPQCLGVIKAARDDFEGNLLIDLKALVQAEVLGDFLDQADALIAGGYHHPAASLAGAILEDGLRKLCDLKGISYPTKTKIDALNADLARAGVYDKLIQKQITALADVRNKADHGEFDKFKPEDTEHMVTWVKRFLADYLK